MSGIPYLTRNWNVTTGCTPVDASETGPCRNCWAKATAERFPTAHKVQEWTEHGEHFRDGTMFSQIVLHPDRLGQPLHWRKPAVVGVSFLGDLFHEAVPDTYIVQVLEIVRRCKRHQFLFLTKRPDRARRLLVDTSFGRLAKLGGAYPEDWPNLWMGTSVWDQPSADRYIPLLLETPAAHRWISIEPMLGPVDLTDMPYGVHRHYNALIPWYRRPRLDWVVVGCESGAKRRPCDFEWIANVEAQCHTAGVPVYRKQDSAVGGPVWRHPPVESDVPPSLWAILRTKERRPVAPAV